MTDPLATVIPREQCVLRYVMERRAGEHPDEVYAVFDEGGQWTYAETLARVRRTAAALQALGVRQGEPVLVMLPNGALGVQCLFAINYLGAIGVAVNPAYKGGILEHVLRNCGARVGIVHPDVLVEIARVDRAELRTLVLAGDTLPEAPPGLALRDARALDAEPDTLRPPERPIEPWDTQSIVYTSGTTGPSKGVLSSYMHAWCTTGPQSWCHVRDDDRHLVHMPLFHIGGTFMCFMAMLRGGSIAVVPGFRTDSFWSTVDRLGVTTVFLLGAMTTFLLKQAPRADDRSHRLRLVFIVPLGANGPVFRERFGVDFCTIFNMSEISTPLLSGLNPDKPNICGRPREGVSLRLVDENDLEVAPGTPGELIIRTDLPWAMNHGYHANPAATAAAWRNGWFHTGDVFQVDAAGDFSFVDRRKDMIRRRGENISAQEIEAEVMAHPAIREAAAIAVPSELGEDDVMVVLSLQPGQTLDPAALLAFLADRMPHFMLPRYLRVVPDLPHTETAKVRKQPLRDEGIAQGTWDREAAGIRVRSQRFD